MTEHRKKRAPGIKLKLLGVLIPVVIGIIGIIIYGINRKTSEIILQKSEDLLQTSTESVINKVTAWMNETITALDMERDTLEYFSLTGQEELDYIKHTADKYESFPAGIYVALTDGTLVHSSFVPGPEYNVFEKSWYIDGMESEKFLFGSVYFDEDSQSYVVGASGVLKDGSGRIRGVAAADIYLDAISEIVRPVQLEQSGGMFLVDTNTNIIIGHRDPSMTGKILNEQDDPMYLYADQLIRNQSYGLQTFTGTDHNEIYLQVEQVPNSKWITVSYVPHQEIVADLNRLTETITGISIFGILLLIVLMERFIHLIIRPVKKLNAAVNAMADGDFTTDVQVRTRDEIGKMASGVHTFILAMRKVLAQIIEITAVLSRQSVNSTEIASSLSEASSLQSQSMNEMNNTVEDLTYSIAEVAENATSLSLLVNDTQAQGAQAGQQMTAAVDASRQGRSDMEELLSSMQDISLKITHLEQSSETMANSIQQINSMVDFIRDIAEETNLLSLNASIEAARAGEAGRGFAIVADQIGKLALNSKNAVEDISSLTAEIGGLVEANVQETMQSVSAIQTGSGVVDQAAAAFRSIYTAVDSTNTAVQTMIEKVQEVNMIATTLAGITEEQSAASEEILATVETMRQNAEDVAANSKTVAADAESLRNNATQLREHLDQFTVE